MGTSLNKISFIPSELIKKFSHGLLLNVLLKLKGFVFLPVLVTFLAKEEVGVIALGRSLSGLFIGLFLLNIPDAANRVIIELEKKKDKIGLNSALNSINIFVIILYLIFSSIVWWFFSFWEYQSVPFRMVLLALVFGGVIKKLGYYLFQIFQHTRLLLMADLVIEYGSFGVVVTMLYTGWYRSVIDVLYVYVFFTVIVSTVLLLKQKRFYSFRLELRRSFIIEVLRISIMLLPASYALVIIQSSDFILIERWLGLDVLGVYSFGYSLGSIVSGLSMAVSFFWYSSAVYANREQLVWLIRKINILVPLGLLLTIVAFHFLAAPIVLWVNESYIGAVVPIKILVVGFFINVLSQIYSGVLYALHKEFRILLAVSIGAILNLLLNYLFLKVYGIQLAALSTSIAYLVIVFMLIKATITQLSELRELRFFIVNGVTLLIAVTYCVLIYNGIWI